jgi:hypothetical protein
MIKKILIVLLAALVIIQFIRPAKNNKGNKDFAITTKYDMPNNVKVVFDKACADCHSNNTKYPWYTNIQPVGYWINHHVNEGKSEINFDEFTNKKIGLQHHKLKEAIEQIEKDEMPLPSYTIIHKDAKLTKEEKDLLINWFQNIVSNMEAIYPKDSLQLKKRTKEESEK